MNPPPALRPLTKTERRDLKRKLGHIADMIEAIDERIRRLREDRRALETERDAISARVYRS
jgi:flagellar biosynthesis chaperone FliJ